MLQIQPEEEIILEFMKQDDYKYIRALGCFYYRMTCPSSVDIYKNLEVYLKDYRRLILRISDSAAL